MMPATTSIRTENAASRTAGATLADRWEPYQDPATPRTPNSRPWATRTCPARAWATIPVSEVTPTMISDPVVAATGLCPST